MPNKSEGNLTAAEVEAARFVDVIIDPTPTGALLTAGTQQALSFLPDARTGSDAVVEADATMGSCSTGWSCSVQHRPSKANASSHGLMLEMFGLTRE